MSQEPNARSVTLRRTFDAPRDLVYRAWTEGHHVTRWMKCDAEAHLEVENWEPAVGARYKTHMWKEGVFEVWGEGEFTVVDPPNVLEYRSDADAQMQMPSMTVRVEFKDAGGKTEVTLTHSGIPNDMMCGIIEGGWTNSMGMLADVVLMLAGTIAGTLAAGSLEEQAEGEAEQA